MFSMAIIIAIFLILLTTLTVTVSVSFTRDGTHRIYYGMITYDGAEINGVYVPWIDMLENWDNYKNDVINHFQDIHDNFGASAVRLLMYPMYPEWGNVGLDFPTPTSTEIDNLKDIIDTAYSEELDVYMVMIVPKEYVHNSPFATDDFYAKNNEQLRNNLYTF